MNHIDLAVFILVETQFQFLQVEAGSYESF